MIIQNRSREAGQLAGTDPKGLEYSVPVSVKAPRPPRPVRHAVFFCFRESAMCPLRVVSCHVACTGTRGEGAAGDGG